MGFAAVLLGFVSAAVGGVVRAFEPALAASGARMARAQPPSS